MCTSTTSSSSVGCLTGPGGTTTSMNWSHEAFPHIENENSWLGFLPILQQFKTVTYLSGRGVEPRTGEECLCPSPFVGLWDLTVGQSVLAHCRPPSESLLLLGSSLLLGPCCPPAGFNRTSLLPPAWERFEAVHTSLSPKVCSSHPSTFKCFS